MIVVQADGTGIDRIVSSHEPVSVVQGASEDVIERVKQRIDAVRERDAWMRYRLRGIADNIKRNTQRLRDEPGLVLPMRELYGKTAVIVSAGASIDTQHEAITEASNSAAVYVTNSASHAVLGNVIVYVESMRSVIAPENDIVPVACDVTSHPDIAARDDVHHMFFKAEGSYSRLAERYRARSIAYGTSVSTAAVALAAAHGARRIVLVGQDLAYDAETGAIYNQWSPLAGMRVEIDAVENLARYVNVPEGVKRDPVTVSQLGDTSLYTTGDFVAVAEWLEGFAQRHPEIDCVNATAKGMGLAGWRTQDLVGALSDAPQIPYGAEPFPALDGLSLVEQLRLCRRWEMLRPEVSLYTTIAKFDAEHRERADDAIKDVIEMYRKAAEEIGEDGEGSAF